MKPSELTAAKFVGALESIKDTHGELARFTKATADAFNDQHKFNRIMLGVHVIHALVTISLILILILT